MLKIKETRNLNLIKKILYNPTIFPFLIEDQSLNDDISFILKGKLRFFGLFWHNFLAGLCIFYPFSDKIHVGHIALLPKFRGKVGKKLAELMLEKYFAENKCKELMSRIKKDNKRSIYFAQLIGFKIFWQNDKYKYMRIKNG